MLAGSACALRACPASMSLCWSPCCVYLWVEFQVASLLCFLLFFPILNSPWTVSCMSVKKRRQSLISLRIPGDTWEEFKSKGWCFNTCHVPVKYWAWQDASTLPPQTSWGFIQTESFSPTTLSQHLDYCPCSVDISGSSRLVFLCPGGQEREHLLLDRLIRF